MEGHWLNGVITPLSIAQCESVSIYYNGPTYLWMWSPFSLDQGAVIQFKLPSGSSPGYLEWLCNIPEGVSYFIGTNGIQYYGTVQPGTSSSCLGELSVDYSLVGYNTAAFDSFTQNPYPTGSLADIHNPWSTPTLTTFPDGSFPTIDANGKTQATSPPTATSSTATRCQPNVLGIRVMICIVGVLVLLFVLLVCVRGGCHENKRKREWEREHSKCLDKLFLGLCCMIALTWAILMWMWSCVNS